MAELEARYNRAYALACQMLLAIIILCVWCLSLVYENCRQSNRIADIEKELLTIINTHE